MRSIAALTFFLGFVACKGTEHSTAGAAAEANTAQAAVGRDTGKLLDGAAYDQFGAGAHAGPALAVADVLAHPEQYDGKEVRFTGPIQSVCQKKGCWMRIGAEPNVFVRFKDYGFFMPLDAAGRTAVVEGTLSVKEIPVAEARHYLEDAGKKDEAAKITQPVKEVTFLATGVALGKSAPERH